MLKTKRSVLDHISLFVQYVNFTLKHKIICACHPHTELKGDERKTWTGFHKVARSLSFKTCLNSNGFITLLIQIHDQNQVLSKNNKSNKSKLLKLIGTSQLYSLCESRTT